MYQTINEFKKGYQHKFNMIRNNKRELAMNIKERAEIWKEYFDKLLNTEEPKELIKIGNREINEVEVEELTTEGVKKAMRNLKNYKVAGTDGIHPELTKYGGNKLLNRIYELMRQILGEERKAEEWKGTIIVPIHKKGDRDRCGGRNSIRKCSLQNFGKYNFGKKLNHILKKLTRDYQKGLRDVRSVTITETLRLN